MRNGKGSCQYCLVGLKLLGEPLIIISSKKQFCESCGTGLDAVSGSRIQPCPETKLDSDRLRARIGQKRLGGIPTQTANPKSFAVLPYRHVIQNFLFYIKGFCSIATLGAIVYLASSIIALR